MFPASEINSLENEMTNRLFSARWSKALLLAAITLQFAGASVLAQAPRVFPVGTQPDDVRLKPLKDLNGFFPFDVPENLELWKQRADELRMRVLVSNGLWPMPAKTPLNAVIHGKSVRDGFTVEKVYFESMPGFYVTGLLFRPENPKPGKLPAVLSPHGHGGRLMDSGPKGIKKQLVIGAERFAESGRMPKIARCVQLARMGCVTFLYDMIDYADNRQLPLGLGHKFSKQRPDFEGKENWGLYSAQAEMRLQSIFGLQTWNTIRALDFLESLPDVDPNRLAVTGGSVGGTQSIILCAIDSRPIASFPNGMVSSSMQGGCTCENASLLRIGTGNVELAALYAPKPQAMTSANDWTKYMLVKGKGFPELQKLYSMYGKKNNVKCADLTHFRHNYNYVTRALMYSWFNKHMKLKLEEPIVEEDYKLLTAQEHAVWNEEHPQPKGGGEFERKLASWIAERDTQLLNDQSKEERLKTIRAAWGTMIGRTLPAADEITYDAGKLRNVSKGEVIPVVTLKPQGDVKFVAIVLHGEGKNGLFTDQGKPNDEIKNLLELGAVVITADLFQQGEFLKGSQPLTSTATVNTPRESAAYTHGYNHSVFARRTHDILSLITYAKTFGGSGTTLIAFEGTTPLVAVAAAIAGDAVEKTVIDNPDFRFANIKSFRDPDFIPGAVKYGDLPALLELNTKVNH